VKDLQEFAGSMKITARDAKTIHSKVVKVGILILSFSAYRFISSLVTRQDCVDVPPESLFDATFPAYRVFIEEDPERSHVKRQGGTVPGVKPRISNIVHRVALMPAEISDRELTS
jgi:hypothetical protein